MIEEERMQIEDFDNNGRLETIIGEDDDDNFDGEFQDDSDDDGMGIEDVKIFFIKGGFEHSAGL